MANKIVANDIVEVRFYCSLYGQYSINTRHYLCDGIVGTGADELAFATDLDTDFAATFKELLSSFAFYEGVAVQIIRPTRRPAVFRNASRGQGSLGDDPLPSQVAGLIKLVTNTATRKGRGRIYLPFASESVNGDDAKPTGPYVANLEALANDLLDDYTPGAGGNTSSLVPVIYNRVLHTTIPLTASYARTLWATQRRRSFLAGGDRIPF